MTWSEPEPLGERSFETRYVTPGLDARLVFDCHREPRKLDVTFAAPDFSSQLVELLKPFASPAVISPAQVVLFDRPGYFRLILVPGRLQAVLRKAAPLRVLAELLAQLEQVTGPVLLRPADCPERALSLAEAQVHIDDRLCTRCLACVLPHVQSRQQPPATPPDEPLGPQASPSEKVA